jgi:hypothetical protein
MSTAVGIFLFLVAMTLFAVVFGLLAAETAHAQRQARKAARGDQ